MGPETNNPKPVNAYDQLAQGARARDLRMNATDGDYSDAQLARLRENLLDYRASKPDRTGKVATWRTLAKKIRSDPEEEAALTRWAYGKCVDGDNEQEIARDVDLYIATETEREGRLPLVETAQIFNLKRGLAVIVEGISQNSITAIIGPNGCGKTSLMRYLCANRVNVIRITIDQHSGSKTGVTRKLAEAVWTFQGRTDPLPKSIREQWKIVVEFFKTRNAVLVIDEVNNLHRNGLEVVRDLHDLSDEEEGQRNLPIVLFGDPRFYGLLKRARSDATGQISGQLARRIAPIFDYERDGRIEDGGSDLYSEADIARILQNDRVRLTGADGIRWIKALANTRGWGLLGFAMRVVRTAWSIAGRRAPITIGHLESALKSTLGKDVAIEVNQAAGGELLRRTA